MNTQCPHCRTVYRIDQARLEAAGGRVRCGHCRRVFDARARLQKELPLEQERAQADGAGGSGTEQPELDLGGAAAHGGVSGVLLSDLDGDTEPGAGAGPSGRTLITWIGVNLVLIVLLFGQILLVQRDAFAQDPALRPLLAGMCSLAGCTLPARRALDRIELVRRNVYAHPNVDDALIIDITFANSAPFSQPYPVLTVSLGDIRGEPLIRRNFRPAEYLSGSDPAARMAPGSPTHVTLEVADPGREARTFEIDFF